MLPLGEIIILNDKELREKAKKGKRITTKELNRKLSKANKPYKSK